MFNSVHVTPPHARGRDQVRVKTPEGQLTPTEGGGCRALVPLSHLEEDRDATTQGRGRSSWRARAGDEEGLLLAEVFTSPERPPFQRPQNAKAL